MPFPQDLFPCTFKGAFWFARATPTTGGRKTAKKPIVNSDRQIVEDLGLQPRAFTINGIVAQRTTNDGTVLQTYQEVKDDILAALESRGTGELVHPFFGSLKNIQVTTWNLDERMTSLGSTPLSVSFEISDTDGLPQEAPAVLGGVVAKSNSANKSLENSVKDNMTITDKFTASYKAAVDKVTDIVAAVEDAVAPLSQITSAIDQFTKDLRDLAADATTLVTTPADLATSIRNSVESMNALFATPVAIFDSMRRLFDFGDLDINFIADTSTSAGKERRKNADLLNVQVQGTALSQAYVAAAQLDLTSVEDIDVVQGLLETQFQKMVVADEWESEPQEGLTETRLALTAFFDAQRATKPRRTTIQLRAQVPARVLAYRFYEDSTRGDQIAELNEVGDAAFVEGEVEILTS